MSFLAWVSGCSRGPPDSWKCWGGVIFPCWVAVPFPGQVGGGGGPRMRLQIPGNVGVRKLPEDLMEWGLSPGPLTICKGRGWRH